MIGRTPNQIGSIERHTFGSLPTIAECTHCNARLWKKEIKKRGKPWCCDGKRVTIPPPETDESSDAQPEHQAVVNINKLIYETEEVQGRIVLTSRCKRFRQLITPYNNSVAFASEGVEKIDNTVYPFTFKIQGSMYHSLPCLAPDDGEKRVCGQIWRIDSSQEQAFSRIGYNPNLDEPILRDLQRYLRACNPYIEAMKTCEERLAENPQPHHHMRISMQDPTMKDPRVFNKPTSDEIAVVWEGDPEDPLSMPTAKDIAVEFRDGSRSYIPYWHSSYMPLRYPVMLPQGDQGWHQNIPLTGARITGRPLHARSIRNVRAELERRNNIPDNPVDENPDDEMDIDRPVGKGGSTRVTTAAFYRYWMMMRPNKFNRVIHAGRLFQRFVTDAYVSVESNRLHYIMSGRYH